MTGLTQTAGLSFAIVMAGMLLLYGICVVMARIGGATLADAADEDAGAFDPVLVAVLTAAATEALGRPVRVHRVHVQHAPESDRWSRAGRLDIMVSHRVGPRR